MRRLFFLAFIILNPHIMFAQSTKIIVLDRADKQPINGLSILTEIGSLIGNTNEKASFFLISLP
ncbi:hypothetical protein [Pedobacter nototheniae]|uniref:hypothetical protein n=1 Tax=Pedobacter nototheniae TaxID=2488994 RepID=UPI00103C6BAD|nr:hypothetical protein [Pedobacter nototheniae]